MLPNGTQVRTQSSWSSSSYSTSSGGGNRRGNGRPQTESGNEDTGWLQLPNGTMVRRQKSWSRTQYETSYGGVQLNPDDRDELVAQLGLGEVHDNEVEDDKKPWSDLDELQRKVDAKAKAFLDGSAAPSNIEPGFENQYRYTIMWTNELFLTSNTFPYSSEPNVNYLTVELLMASSYVILILAR